MPRPAGGFNSQSCKIKSDRFEKRVDAKFLSDLFLNFLASGFTWGLLIR